IIVVFAGIDFVLGGIFNPPNYNSFRIQNRIYHHGLKKNVSTEACWGPLIYNFYTNNLSFRDDSNHVIPLKSDNKRILILGDSHSEGVGIEFQYTFAGLLKEMGKDKNIDVLNASAISYSPKIH